MLSDSFNITNPMRAKIDSETVASINKNPRWWDRSLQGGPPSATVPV